MVWVCSAAETEALTRTVVSHCVAISDHDKASYTRLYNVYTGFACRLKVHVETTYSHSCVCPLYT